MPATNMWNRPLWQEARKQTPRKLDPGLLFLGARKVQVFRSTRWKSLTDLAYSLSGLKSHSNLAGVNQSILRIKPSKQGCLVNYFLVPYFIAVPSMLNESQGSAPCTGMCLVHCSLLSSGLDIIQCMHDAHHVLTMIGTDVVALLLAVSRVKNPNAPFNVVLLNGKRRRCMPLLFQNP